MGANLAHPEETGVPYTPELLERYQLIPQGLSAELIAERWEIPRPELDALRW
jgi:acetyl-CoA acyltransferase